jgi:hypothetical protein
MGNTGSLKRPNILDFKISQCVILNKDTCQNKMLSSSDEEVHSRHAEKKTLREKRNAKYYRKKHPNMAANKYYPDNVDYGPEGLNPSHVEIGAEADKIAEEGHANIVEWPAQLPPDHEEDEEDQRTVAENNSLPQQLGRKHSIYK